MLYSNIKDMKSQLQLVILQFILVSCSLLATNATDHQQCDKLLHQCYQFRNKCSEDTITLRSCCDLVNLPMLSKTFSSVYQITTNCSCHVSSFSTETMDVYCDMNTTDGGWMVIQRNKKDGVKTFNTKWKDFEEGFGDLNEDKMWYGLKALNCFTETGEWEFRIDFQFENKTWSHLHYKQFKVESSSAEYPLTIGGFTGITPTDPFVTHPLNSMRFSTSDNDNDQNIGGNCAASYSNGWWYNNCFHIGPNYQPRLHLIYVYLNSKSYNLLSVEMKIRQHDYISQ